MGVGNIPTSMKFAGNVEVVVGASVIGGASVTTEPSLASVASVGKVVSARLTLGARVPEITGVNDTVSLGGAPAEVCGDVHAFNTSAPSTTPAARKC
jgi:hypothetical protein